MARQLKLPNIDIAFNSKNWPDKKHLETLARQAISAIGEQGLLEWPDGAELSLVLTNDAEIQKINAEWRKINKPTNVLSFPGNDIAAGEPSGLIIGDIILAYETLITEANERGIHFDDHFTHLLVHGFLHLFGYDHETLMDAEAMEKLEAKILASLGICDPYAESL